MDDKIKLPVRSDWKETQVWYHLIDAENKLIALVTSEQKKDQIVSALNNTQAEQAKRIEELEQACEVVIRNIDADAVTAGWASNYLKKWLGKEHPTTNNQSKANAKGESNHGD